VSTKSKGGGQLGNSGPEPLIEEDDSLDRKLQESQLSILLEHPTASDLDPNKVRTAFERSHLLTLGAPVEPPSEGSDLLHFTIDDKGTEKVLLPTFTSVVALRQALLLNQDWQTLSVLEIDGGELLPNVDADVTVVVDPWTPLEYFLPFQRDKQ
jgi:hypothetical protein